MALSKIALIVLIALFVATAASAQDEQKKTAPPQNATSDGSQPDASAPSSPIHEGANVTSAILIRQVSPVYPALAKTAGISGTVVLHAIIAKDGTIEQLRVVSGPPLLLKSAMDAVRQWVYQPTLVKGDPVRVDTTISVAYALGEKNPNSAEGSGSTSDVSGSQAEAPTTAGVNPSRDSQEEPATTQTPDGASSEPNSSAPKRIRVGGNVAQAQLVHQVTPVYPDDAKMQHISGTVLLHVIIAQDGSMKTVEYVSGPPELRDSTIEAVKKWRYKPTLLRGEPIEVDTTISVVFTLGNH